MVDFVLAILHLVAESEVLDTSGQPPPSSLARRRQLTQGVLPWSVKAVKPVPGLHLAGGLAVNVKAGPCSVAGNYKNPQPQPV